MLAQETVRVSKVDQILASRYSDTIVCNNVSTSTLYFKGHTPDCFQSHLWHLNANNTNVLLWILNRHSDRHAPWIAKERHLRSKIRWFTEFCNSHYLSHLAAFFIDPRAKRSTVRSCLYFFLSNSHTGEWHSNSGKHDVRSLKKKHKKRSCGAKKLTLLD